jgi:hypothetical protein
MPSSKLAVTLLFRYCLAGAPCGGACAGMVGTGVLSGCAEAARDAGSAVGVLFCVLAAWL